MVAKIQWPLKTLPTRYVLENTFIRWGIIILSVAIAQWLLNTWRIEYRKWVHKTRGKGFFVPSWPVKIEVFNPLRGMSCHDITEQCRAYGIPIQRLSIQWELWPDGNGIGLQCAFYVPTQQADFADCILNQHQGANYWITSPARKLRGYSIGQPWGVRAKPRSFDEALTDLLFARMYAAKKAPSKTSRKTTTPPKRGVNKVIME